MTQQPTTPTKKPIWKRWWFIALVVVVILGALLNLGGGDDEAAPATSTSPTASSAATETTEAAETEPVTECLGVSELVAQSIAETVDDDAKAAASGAVKTGESYLVAVKLSGPEAVDGLTPVFEVLSLDEVTSMRAVDGVAHEFTQFPESAFSVADPEVEDALACAS